MRRIGTLALALALLTWSIATLVVDTFYAVPYREIAKELELGSAVPDGAYFERIDRTLRIERLFPLCSRDITRSAVSVKLVALDAASRQDGAYAALEPALARAATTLRNALRCLPGDGNFWLRLAMVDYASRSSPDAVGQALTNSLATAPSEGWIVMPRFAFAAQMMDSANSGVGTVLKSDAHNLVYFARASDMAHLYVAAPRPVRLLMDEQIAHVSDARRVELRRAIAEAAEGKAARQPRPDDE
jgi:hypothetical protein